MFYHSAGFIQLHFSIHEIAKQTCSVMHTYCYEICPALRIIIICQPYAPTVMEVWIILSAHRILSASLCKSGSRTAPTCKRFTSSANSHFRLGCFSLRARFSRRAIFFSNVFRSSSAANRQPRLTLMLKNKQHVLINQLGKREKVLCIALRAPQAYQHSIKHAYACTRRDIRCGGR